MSKNAKINEIISLIFATRRFFNDQMVEKSGNKFSFLQYKTLQYIKERKPLMKEIAEFLGVTPPSATTLADNLIKSKMVERESVKKDRRIVRIVITKKGEGYLKKNARELSQKMEKGLDSLDGKDQENLVRILKKLLSNFNSNHNKNA
jgi:DNA-binding MarR family transcriptional regulator